MENNKIPLAPGSKGWVQPHRRHGTGYAMDPLGSARHRIGDRFSKREKRIHFGNEKDRSDTIHGNNGTSCGKRIRWIRGQNLSIAWRCRQQACPLWQMARCLHEGRRRIKATEFKSDQDLWQNADKENRSLRCPFAVLMRNQTPVVIGPLSARHSR